MRNQNKKPIENSNENQCFKTNIFSKFVSIENADCNPNLKCLDTY